MAIGVPNYLPGFEPDDIKKLLDSFFGEIDKSFPDKVIVWSEWNHEKLDKSAGYLCKYLGYSRGTDFLNAYGYSVVMERKQESVVKASSKKESSVQSENRRTTINSKAPKKKKTGLIIVFCLLAICFIVAAVIFIPKLSGSKGAKEFDKQVDVVYKQSEVSESDISYLTNAYNALSPSEKLEVKNYDNYQTIMSKYAVDNYNIKIRTAISEQNFKEMQALYNEINKLDSSTRESINSFLELENVLPEMAYNTILSYDNNTVEEMYKLIVEFKEFFSDDQLKEAMLNYARWNGYSGAVEYIKSALKNPNSYKMYNATVKGFTVEDRFEDGAFKGVYTIEYGASNTFGGEVTTTTLVLAKAYIDFENLTVKYTYIGEYGTKESK